MKLTNEMGKSFGQENAEGQDSRENSSEQLEVSVKIEREKIEGTPFYLVGSEEQGYFIALGVHRLTDKDSKEGTLEKLESEMWMIVANMVVIVANEINVAEKLANRTVNDTFKD